MNKWWWNPWFAWPVSAFILVCGWLLSRMSYGDELIFWNDWREQPMNFLFKQLTRLGEFAAYLLAVFVLLFYKYRFAIVLIITGLAALLVSNRLKSWAKVPRPIAYFEQTNKRDNLVLVPGESLNRGRTSFPSGHTTGAFALFTCLTLMLPLRMRVFGLPFALMAILAGLSRIFLVQHFLADVMAGTFLGIAIAYAVWPLNRWLVRWPGLEGNLVS